MVQDVQSAISALEMDGFKLGDRNIKVGQPSDQSETKDSGGMASPLQAYMGLRNSTLVILSGLHPALTPTMISNIVAAFGKVVTCVETQPPQQQQQQMWTAQVQFESVSSAFCLVACQFEWPRACRQSRACSLHRGPCCADTTEKYFIEQCHAQ